MNGKNIFCNSGGTCHWNWILCTAKTGSYLLKVIAAPWACIKVQKFTHDMYNMNVLGLGFHPVWDSNKISKSLGLARISDRWRLVVEIHLHPQNSRFCVVFYTRLSAWSHWAHGNVSLNDNNRIVQNGKCWISRWNSGTSSGTLPLYHPSVDGSTGTAPPRLPLMVQPAMATFDPGPGWSWQVRDDSCVGKIIQ